MIAISRQSLGSSHTAPATPAIDSNRFLLRDVYRLWTRRKHERRLTFRMERRGVFLFSGHAVRRGDFLGLSLTDERFDAHRTLLVYPPKMQNAELLEALGSYSDEELSKLSTARRYQLAQQCLYLAAAKPEEARALVTRLGSEYLAWFDYVLERKRGRG